jgi:hypothetical protein
MVCQVARDKTVTPAERSALDKVYALLTDGKPAREADLNDEERGYDT